MMIDISVDFLPGAREGVVCKWLFYTALTCAIVSLFGAGKEPDTSHPRVPLCF